LLGEFVAYPIELYARRNEAVEVERIAVEINGRKPDPKLCHDNADIWVEGNPEYSVCRGWFYFELEGAQWVRFVAHSVIVDEHGALFDITPTTTETIYSFIAAGLVEQDFKNIEALLIETHGTSTLDHLLIKDDI